VQTASSPPSYRCTLKNPQAVRVLSAEMIREFQFPPHVPKFRASLADRIVSIPYEGARCRWR